MKVRRAGRRTTVDVVVDGDGSVNARFSCFSKYSGVLIPPLLSKVAGCAHLGSSRCRNRTKALLPEPITSKSASSRREERCGSGAGTAPAAAARGRVLSGRGESPVAFGRAVLDRLSCPHAAALRGEGERCELLATGRTRHLNEPMSDPGSTQWAHRDDERPKAPMRRNRSSATCTLRPVARARANSHHEGDPGVDPPQGQPARAHAAERRRARD